MEKVALNDGDLYLTFKVPNLELKKTCYDMLNNALFQKLSGDGDGFQTLIELKSPDQ
ncbi:MAG: hypothetical protein LBR53_03710 [Deltaproteobacteria bacterium]|nr:hypothetical protein [Deltaproteobacteria bacterium]